MDDNNFLLLLEMIKELGMRVLAMENLLLEKNVFSRQETAEATVKVMKQFEENLEKEINAENCG